MVDPTKLAQQLLSTFVDELEVHVAKLNVDLLALERGLGERERDETLHSLFRTVHTIKGSSRAAGVPLIERSTHHLEDVLGGLREHRLVPGPRLFEVLFQVTDALADAGERLRRSSSMEGATLEGLLPRLAELQGDAVAGPIVAVAPPAAVSGPSSGTGVRLPAERLDELVAAAMELTVAFGRVDARAAELEELATGVGERSAAIQRFAALHREDRRKLGAEIARVDEQIKRLRMVPFREVAEPLQRVVRDVALASRKEVSLVVRGGDTEVDRGVLDGLRHPLLHLVRNAVDHGLETMEERRRAGKQAVAAIVLTAALRGSEVIVTVADDGRGIDLDAIRAALRKKQLPEPSSDADLARVIFSPGFSTARLVTDVSGRGVGLDVVMRGVEALRGSIDLSFGKGAGTTFTVVVPLTLSSLRVLLVRTSGQVLAIPGTAVVRLLRVGAADVAVIGGRQTVAVDGAPVVVVSLGEILGHEERSPLVPGKASLVVVASQGARLALAVDELLDTRETVVKSVGKRLAGATSVSGTTVLADGTLALIVNVPELLARARTRPGSRAVLEETAADTTETRRDILLVDDSPTTRTLEKSILESAGYHVRTATNGAEAWEMLQREAPGLIVSDVEMPELDGFALTELVRGSPRLRHLPIILVTALASDADKARGLSVGASAYLIKSSFDQTTLLETIAQLL